MKRNYPSVAKACTSGRLCKKLSKNHTANKRRIMSTETPCPFWVWRWVYWFRPGLVLVYPMVVVQFGPSGAVYGVKGAMERSAMNGGRSASERRKWARLPLAIPVFVRSRDEKGKEFLEFATSLNVSAGGMLVAIRRVLPAIAQIRLEIPSAPVAAMALLPRAQRTLNAKTLRTTPAQGYYLLGLKFSRPLHLEQNRKGRRRKLVSTL